MRPPKTLVLYAANPELAGEYAFTTAVAGGYRSAAFSEMGKFWDHCQRSHPDVVLVVGCDIEEVNEALSGIRMGPAQLPVAYLAAHVPGDRPETRHPCRLVLDRAGLFEALRLAARRRRGPKPRLERSALELARTTPNGG